ncbi:hypothetical protein ALE3EI_2407 [Constantimarinum furrinae]|uniref:Uncharacterized protein n=1 Tax=Constantimarinum furrinae TaxID=2562285 RepID=A0A7G8PX79_9FLAO|nr:hypothetical protein ALE3EI_2407 [Constantimarinum furrinae]
MLDICLIIILLFLGFKAKYLFRHQLDKSDSKTLNLLWAYHLVICVAFYFYVLANGGDAITYWTEFEVNPNMTMADYFSLGFGTYFMYVLNYIPSKLFELSFLTGSVAYALLGYIGFLFFYVIFKQRIAFNSKLFQLNLFPFIFFLPNLHFWTAGVGKDTLMFFCIAIFFYAMQQPKKHLIKILLAMFLVYFTRPHIAAFLLLSFGIGYILDGGLKVYVKIFFFIILVGAFVGFFDTIMLYLRIENFDLETISSYSEDKVSKLSRSHTGTGVDISSYSFPLKVFTFLFRPLFFDVNGVLAIIASLENLLLLILTAKFIWLNPIKLFFKASYFFKSLFIFFILGVISFSLILGNLGIMLRQKNMFIPALLFLCLWAFSYSIQNRTANSGTP